MDDGSTQESLLRPNAEEDLKARIYAESKKIWRIATPGVIAKVTSFGTLVVTQAFLGHVSAVDLAAFALVQTLSFQFVNGVLLGMSSATETICGQAFGAKQYSMMGIYLQQSWLIDFITLSIFLPLFIFGTQIFGLLGQDKGIAKPAGYISLWFIPFPYVVTLIFSYTVQMYLQAQQKNMIITWLSALRFATHVLCSWLFVYVLGFGGDGAMAALCISSWLLVLAEFVYVFCGWCPDSWRGFDVAAFKDLWPVVKLSVSSGFMMCLELWYYVVLVLLASYMKDAQVAVSTFSICLNVVSWITMIFLGLMGAACVAHTISELSPLLALTVLLSGICPVLSGVAIGSGLQTKVAAINLVCFYAIGLPIGFVLGFLLHLQVKSLWVGLACGVVADTVAISYLIWRTNWETEVLNTSARLKRLNLEKSDENKHRRSVDA